MNNFKTLSNSIFENSFNLVLLITMLVICISISTILYIKAKRTGSYQLRNYCATLWTSMGILGTFISIYYSLVIESSSENLEMMQLIKNIIPAFSTSIVGIIGAVVCTITSKWAIANQEEKEDDLFADTRHRIGISNCSNSPELILLEIVKSIKGSNVLLTKLKDTISDNHNLLENSLSKKLTQQEIVFKSAVEGIASKFESTLRSTQQSFREEIRTLTTNLEGKIQSMADSNKDILKETVKLQGAKLDFIKETLMSESKTRSEQLTSFIDSENTRMQGFVEEQNTAFGALYTRIDERITSHIDKEEDLFKTDIKQSITEFAEAQYATCIETITKCNNDLVKRSQELISSQEQANETFVNKLSQQLSNALALLPTEIEKLSSDITGKLQEIHNIEKGLIESTINDNKDHVDQMLGAHEGIIKQISTNISISLDELVANFTDTTKAVIQRNEELKKDFVDGTKSLSEDIVKQIRNAMSVQDLEQSCSRLNTEINNTINGLQGKLNIIASQMKKISDSVSQSAQMYNDAVNKSNDINKYIDSTKNLFGVHTNALGQMENSLKNMEQSVNRLNEQLHSMASPQTEHINTKTTIRTK